MALICHFTLTCLYTFCDDAYSCGMCAWFLSNQLFIVDSCATFMLCVYRFLLLAAVWLDVGYASEYADFSTPIKHRQFFGQQIWRNETRAKKIATAEYWSNSRTKTRTCAKCCLRKSEYQTDTRLRTIYTHMRVLCSFSVWMVPAISTGLRSHNLTSNMFIELWKYEQKKRGRFLFCRDFRTPPLYTKNAPSHV